jgi:hypothetical protein
MSGMTAILPHAAACADRAAAPSGGTLALLERPPVFLDDDVVEFLD